MKKTLLALFAVAALSFTSVNAQSVSAYTTLNAADGGQYGGLVVPVGVDNYAIAFHPGFESQDSDTKQKEAAFIGLAGVPMPIIDDVQINLNFENNAGSNKTEFEGVNIEKQFTYEVVPNLEVGVLVDILRFTTEDGDKALRGVTTAGESRIAVLNNVVPVVSLKLFEL